MTDLIKMDIFFFVTTIVVLALGVLVGMILYRALRILGYVETISKNISDESVLVRADIADLRENIRLEGFKIKHLVVFFRNAAKRFVGKGK